MIKYVYLLLSMAVLRASAQTAELVYPDYHHGAVVGMEYSQNKQWLLTGGADGRAMLWNAKNKTLINVGTWCFMIGIMGRFFDLVGTMLFTGSIFILFGVVLILIAYIGEKYRKNLIKKVFKNYVIQ